MNREAPFMCPEKAAMIARVSLFESLTIARML